MKTDLRKNPGNPWQLFNLKNDRDETTDIAAQQPDILKKFDEIVKKEHQEPANAAWQFVLPVIAAGNK